MKTPEPIIVTDIIGEVVTATSNAIVKRNPNKILLQVIQENETAALEQQSLIKNIRYSKSSFDELIETLAQADKVDATGGREYKYPLIHLVRDFAEDYGVVPGYSIDVSLNIIFVHQTVATYKIDDRDDKVFKPVLIPIKEEFITQLAKHKQIVAVHRSKIPYREWKRAFWGTRQLQGAKNKLADYVDAIELENLKLKIIQKPC